MSKRNATAELVCQKQFTANDIEYGVGQVIPQSDVEKWADNSLANRLNNGFCTYRSVLDAEAAVVEAKAAVNEAVAEISAEGAEVEQAKAEEEAKANAKKANAK